MSMRISLFTGTLNIDRFPVIKRAAVIAARRGTSMLVLPGYSLGHKQNDYESQKSFLRDLSNTTGVSILAEADHTDYFRPGMLPIGPFKQLFSHGSKVPPDEGTTATSQLVKELINEFKRRIIKMEKKCIGILLWGENNVLRNVDHHKPQMRFHPNANWPHEFVYDILLNPSHTVMGQWNLLHQRFACFSKPNRFMLYCTNNAHPRSLETAYKSWASTLCVYRNGEEIKIGNFDKVGSLPGPISMSWGAIRFDGDHDWRLLTIEMASF